MSIAAAANRPACTRRLTADEIARYHADGFVAVPGLFSAAEIAPLQQACAADPTIKDAVMAVADSSGNAQEVIAWTSMSDDLVGLFPRVARLVEAAEDLIGEEVYHWHSKLSLKRPMSAGRWDWHQDYGYWYHEGCLFPKMLTCMIAVDPATRENGCVQLVTGSHLMGRIEHPRIGEASGADPERLAQAFKQLPVVDCVMAPGDAVFFHCNTLHASGPNRTETSRTLLHCSYNAASNSPFADGQDHHRYQPLDKLRDSIISDGGYRAVFANHEFHEVPADGAVNNYGYRVIGRKP